ncbi:MAG TPA: hypothetical protein VIW46_00345 [Acidimicrobiia bacterium]|jgi:hypothetical protein
MIALVLASALVVRARAIDVALTIGALRFPVVTGTAVLGLGAATAFREAKVSRVDPTVGEIVSVAGDLRAGRPLRAVVASGAFGERLASVAASGMPIRAASLDWLATFGPDARLVDATLELAVDAGGPVAGMFEQLAAGMIEAERTRRERRSAMAPAVAQALVVGGVPVVTLAQMVISGRWVDLVSRGGVTAGFVLPGTAAVVMGVAWVAFLVGGRRWR